jgi:Amt family ammonium transporter
VAIWVTIVYFPVAHWVFYFGNKAADGTITGAGWLAARGVEDFAGGTAVHINAGAAGLALAIVLGRRIGFKKNPNRPHNLPLVMIGAGLLWFGWFGFNAGSALAANGQAVLALMNTQVATAAALGGWLIVEKIRDGHPTTLGAASGAVAGLVAITPACGYVEPWAALLIGGIAGAACYFGLFIKGRFKLDDALDVLGVHGVGGSLGAILTGVFATSAVNSAIKGHEGLLYGNPSQVLIQLVGVLAAWAFSFGVSMVLLYGIKAVMGIRVDEEAEIRGLDLAEHGEEGYLFE